MSQTGDPTGPQNSDARRPAVLIQQEVKGFMQSPITSRQPRRAFDSNECSAMPLRMRRESSAQSLINVKTK
ncbi:hypothetical protein SRHO_G00118400 [Serrasalmus rhombeus]